MLSPRGVQHADQLRAMLDDGALPDIRPVELVHGTADNFDRAVRIVLAVIDRLSSPEADSLDLDARWFTAEADVEALWWFAATWRAVR